MQRLRSGERTATTRAEANAAIAAVVILARSESTDWVRDDLAVYVASCSEIELKSFEAES
jgi:hypothetical protein